MSKTSHGQFWNMSKKAKDRIFLTDNFRLLYFLKMFFVGHLFFGLTLSKLHLQLELKKKNQRLMKIMLFDNISTFLYETFANGKKCIFLDC